MDPLFCKLCNIRCDNAGNYVTHVTSKRHLNRVNMGTADFYCRACERQIDNRINFQSHCASRAHINNCTRVGMQHAAPWAGPVVQVQYNIDLDDDDEWDDVIIGHPRAPVVQPAIVLRAPEPTIRPAIVVRQPTTIRPAVILRAPEPAIVAPVDIAQPTVAPEVERPCVHQHAALQHVVPAVSQPAVPRFADAVRGLTAPVPCAIRQPVHRADLMEPDATSPTIAPASLKRTWANIVAADLR